MRLIIFSSVVHLAGFLTGINNIIGNATTSLLVNFFNSVNDLIKSSCCYLAKIIDEERFNHMNSTAEQYANLMELDLLMSATKIKEDALKRKLWTTMHTIAINKIGTALHLQCGWEPARVHGYLRQVIESIPGMTYMVGDEQV